MIENASYQISIQGKWYNPDLLILNSANEIVAKYEYWIHGHRAMINGSSFEIKQKSKFWDSPLEIYDNGSVIGSMEFTWRNNFVIKIQNDFSIEKKYFLQAKGFWNNDFILKDSDGNEIAIIKSKRKHYLIEIIDLNLISISIEKLLIICGYGTYRIIMR